MLTVLDRMTLADPQPARVLIVLNAA